MGRLVIDGNSVYEIDEECERRQRKADGAESRMRREKDLERSETQSGRSKGTTNRRRR